MNNEQFRRLIAANAAKSPTSDNNGASSTPSRGVALGSRQKSCIPMTPRSVAGLSKSNFARQLAERNQPDKKEKKFRSFAPKGSKLAEGYVDRTQARNSKEEEEGDDRATRLKALEEAFKKEEIDQPTFDHLRSQIAGGDLSSTHLVKGLDFKLLERIRKGENVYNNSEAHNEEDETPEDVDDELDRLEEEEVSTMTKEKTIKKGQLSTAPTNASKKRTRDQILAEMKAARGAAQMKKESTLGDKFRKIGVKAPGTRIERDGRGREVMIITDEDGNEKRKVRKIVPEEPSQEANDLMVPDPKAKPLGMEVPDKYKSKAKEPEESDDIFDDVDDDYDPLAGLDDSSDEDDKDDEASAEQAKAESADKEANRIMPPPSRPVGVSEPRDYFKDSKTGLVSSETLAAPSMSDPAIQAAFKKAASLRAIADSSEEDDKEAREKAERLRKMLQNNDRDAQDLDMGFGTSRLDDDADLDEQRVKLSEWGRDEEEGGDHSRGGSKRKRGPKKRKGDGNNAADVLRDVFAILLGAYHPGIKLLGISTVHGNASLQKTTNNALSVLSAIGKDDSLRVYPGAANALERDAVPAVEIHGESGLDGTALLPPPARSALDASMSAVDAMASALRACEPGTPWVVGTGALTNVAQLFTAHPDLRSHVAGVSIMGGSVGDGFTAAPLGRVDDVERIGNYSQWAEFNVLIDPEAAAALLHDPILAPKSTLVPLDLTHLVLATKEVQDLLLKGTQPATAKAAAEDLEQKGMKAKSTLRQMLVELLMFFAETYRDVFGIVDGPPLHDPLAVAAILTGTRHEIPFYDFDPASPQGPERRERFEVRVVTEGTLEDAREKGTQTGRTVVRLLPPGEEGVRIPRGLDIELFWKVIEDCVQKADDVNAQKAGTVV
ncbi:inosine-uridine preferring nucleoside hydrolase-domain-containing protein [Xylaria bambusicola]|uniref:inosine-uridine preferring nucleoside hydrolase-domain-containing protein n=1 Tax=Xylaria bambusicola TaxID=326684 RepID=UPI0020083FD0|nr:inosine-uridine preferring nucleoside hydrolase-domain-containing protein [Xylaria bambusicola]KAI0506116.1 inosine-uridine preferring nucleoside hydrolase-domain-containing protein [Xylaria bambusicola]